jgi:hypothetical protein
MQIVGALDVHRRQITHKTLDLASGDLRRGRLSPATRESVREWLERFTGCEAEFALEGTTAGGSSSRRSSGPGTSRISPTRRRQRPSGGTSDARRPTVPTATCS